MKLDNACVRAGERVIQAINRQDWEQLERLIAPKIELESRRKIVGFAPMRFSFEGWRREMSRYLDLGFNDYRQTIVAIRGDRFALSKLLMDTRDDSIGAPRDEALQVVGLDEDGRIALQVSFDVEDVDAALAELESRHARLDAQRRRRMLENTATRADDHAYALFARGCLDEIGALYAEDLHIEDRRHGFYRE